MKKLLFNIKGSRCDYSFHTQESDYARRMYNMRIVTDKDAGTYVLENELGTTLFTCIQKPNVTSYFPTTYGFPPNNTHTLIGCYYVLDKLYLFFAKNNRTGSPKDLIFEVTISNTSYQVKTLVEENLNFDKEHPLLIVSYYESEVLHKLYFIDGINYLTAIKINEYNGVYKINTLSSINSQLSSISFNVDVQEGGGLFKPSIRSYGCVFLDAYGITTNCILDNIKYEIANYDGKANSPDTVLNKTITVKVYFNKTIKNTYEYIKLYSFSRESYYGETIVLSVYKSNANINLKNATLEPNGLYSVMFLDFNNGEAESLSNIYLSSTNIVPSAISSNGEYLLLGNNKYSYDTKTNEIVILDESMAEIYFDLAKKVVLSHSADANLNYDGFCADPLTIRNSTKYYFKSGELYRLGYLLYYDNGDISDIVPFCLNSKGYSVKIPPLLDNTVNEDNNRYYVNRYVITIKILNSGIKKLKLAKIVGIKFFFKQNLSNEKKILCQSAFIPSILFSRYSFLSYGGVLLDTAVDPAYCFAAPMMFFRPGFTLDDYRNTFNYTQSFSSVDDNAERINAGFYYEKLLSSPDLSPVLYNIVDYPTLLTGYLNNSTTYPYYTPLLFNNRISPNIGEVVSPEIAFSNNFYYSQTNILLSYAGWFDVSASIVAYKNTNDNLPLPKYCLGTTDLSKIYHIAFPGDYGNRDYESQKLQIFYFTPVDNIWWALSRGEIDTKNFSIYKFTKTSYFTTSFDVEQTCLAEQLYRPVLKMIEPGSGYNYTDINRIYPAYRGANNYFYLEYGTDYDFKGLNDWRLGAFGLFDNMQHKNKRLITTSWNITKKQKSLLCYFPVNKINSAVNIRDYVGPYAWAIENLERGCTPIIELSNKIVLYTDNNQDWVEAQSKTLYNISDTTNVLYCTLDIGDTTISQYLYEVSNVNGNDNFTATVSSIYGKEATATQNLSARGSDPKNNPCSIKSFVICPLETQLSLYYENFNLSTLLNKSWDFKEEDLIKINNVFNDRRSFLLFLQYNEAEIKGTELKNEIIALGPKQPNELNDRWLNLSNNNILTYYLNGEYGAINSLKSIDNAVYAFTDKAIFKVGFNLTSSIPSSTLYLLMARNPSFTGDYIIAEVGCNDNEKVLQTTNGLYLLSNTHKELYSIQGDKVSAMGLMKFNKSALKHFNYDKWNPYKHAGAILRYNAHYNELYIIDGGDSSNSPLERSDDLKFGNLYYDEAVKCFTYSELLGEFTSYYDYWYSPYWFFVGDTQYSITENNRIYLMHTGKYSLFYQYTYRDGFTTKTVPLCSLVSFTIIHNLEIDKNKILYSISYSGGLYTKNISIDLRNVTYSFVKDTALYTETKRGFLYSAIEKLRIKNDYLDTGVIDVSQNLTSGINSYIPLYSKQKLLTWNILIPRDSFKTIGTNKYKNQRMLNTWNEVTVALPTTTQELTVGNKVAKIWNLTLNYN